ncbi:ABC transporter ATP-binding protein [Philodulcilactobacillus myokoensis]|uniref:ABC transporter ATP-binding protein n=1 Tax=Philodulcilactobacillus myokoensis TaxID=2929573 RepID=A0A9W6B0A0_9LACO|nr:ABC transporter ATP-binding protein [Philodulcilactobacillus myokoensis]GLB46467.1 ABC transporter ATP-binding protein [Philodulcilactobacillus myokoensis]
MSLLVAKNLTKKFKNKVAVNHIDFQINAGELIAFLGPNGAGKSTTIGMLVGILKPDDGKISLHGLSPNQKNYHHQIGIVFQNSVLDDNLSVQDNLNIRAHLYQKIDSSFVKKIIKLFGIDLILNQKYKTLSGGQKRRVDIARALLHQPKLLFLDEPSSGLDIQTRNKIWETLNRLRKEYGLTILLTTHYLEEAENADYVYIIDRGEIKASGDVQKLKLKYTTSLLTLWSDQMDQLKHQIHYKYQAIDQHQIKVNIDDDSDAINLIASLKPLIKHFEYQHGTMNDLFVKLTGKGIR